MLPKTADDTYTEQVLVTSIMIMDSEWHHGLLCVILSRRLNKGLSVSSLFKVYWATNINTYRCRLSLTLFELTNNTVLSSIFTLLVLFYFNSWQTCMSLTGIVYVSCRFSSPSMWKTDANLIAPWRLCVLQLEQNQLLRTDQKQLLTIITRNWAILLAGCGKNQGWLAF